MIVCALVFVVLGSVLAELSDLPPRWYITVIIIIIIIRYIYNTVHIRYTYNTHGPSRFTHSSGKT